MKNLYSELPNGYQESIQKGLGAVRYFSRNMSFGTGTDEERIHRLKEEIENADEPSAKRLEKIDEYREAFANPYRAAERGYVDRVIMPEETRKAIFTALEGIESKRETRPRKKHGVIPH